MGTCETGGHPFPGLVLSHYPFWQIFYVAELLAIVAQAYALNNTRYRESARLLRAGLGLAAAGAATALFGFWFLRGHRGVYMSEVVIAGGFDLMLLARLVQYRRQRSVAAGFGPGLGPGSGDGHGAAPARIERRKAAPP